MQSTNKRPGIWIGHVTRRVRDVKKSAEFFEAIGLRLITMNALMAILELRGGTHLLLFSDTPDYRTIPNDKFDLMVEDVEASHRALQAKGVKVSKVKKDRFHTYFEASDPDRHRWRINSDHTEGRPV
jgi:catechol 2,3-dioxygenase-like lactoylglutathione lyase family enzyme